MKPFSISIVFALCTSFAFAAPNSEALKQAVEHISGCGNFLRADNQYVYTGFGSYYTGSQINRKPQASVLRFIDIATLKESQVMTDDAAIDLVTHQNKTYVLTYSGLEEWNIANRQRQGIYQTNTSDNRYADEEHAQAMALYQNKLIVAHGRLGVSIFDLNLKRVTKTVPLISQGNLESMAKGVAVVGQYAFVVLDSYTLVSAHQKVPFRGIVVIDMQTETVVREIGDLPPGLDSITADQDSLVLSFYGMPLWRYTVSSVLSAKKAQPIARVFKFPLEGSPKDKAMMDDKYYYTCFSKMPGPGEGSYYKRIKLVMNRAQIMLK
tara:strand:- start:22654 stop:23622 length:969 start_codon:yes stop_codon:yes gene_type:complete